MAAAIVRAGRPMHGKTSRIAHDGTSIFAGLPSPIRAARYHSLVIVPAIAAPSLRVTGARATTARSWRSSTANIRSFGVQFHPESAATEYGYALSIGFSTARALPDLPARADGARIAAGGADPGRARGRAALRAAAGGPGPLVRE